MKKKHNAGFSLIEVVIAIAVLAVIVVPTGSAMVMSVRMNKKTDSLLQAQLAVSSAVETLMAEGIAEEIAGDATNTAYDVSGGTDNFPDAKVSTVRTNSTDPYYSVTVTDNGGLVTVETTIRAK